MESVNEYEKIFDACEFSGDKIERLRIERDQAIAREAALKSSYDENRKALRENVKLREEVKRLNDEIAEMQSEFTDLEIERNDINSRRITAEADSDKLAEELERWEDDFSYYGDALEDHNKLKAERGT